MIPIAGGFAPGKILHVTGTFTPAANSFVMKLQSGQVGDPTDEIGLCIYGRVAEGVIGRNAFTRAAGWGQEEATSSPAFARGQNFDITILCDPAQFKIALNQNHFAEFNHRANPASLTFLNISSTSQDVTVACVWVEDGPGAPQPQPGFAQPPVSGFEPPPPYSGGPGFAPQYSSPQMYQQAVPNYQQPIPPQPYMPPGAPPPQYGQAAPHNQSSSGMGGKGLLGMVAGAGTAVAGALGASHLLGKKSHSHSGYPGMGGHHSRGGYPGMGGYPGHHKGGGGMLNKVMGLAGPAAGAAMLAKGKPSKAMKYGVPLAAMGAGGYVMHKGLRHGFHGGHSSSSGSGSSEEE
ncbi:galectin-9-like isoform X3 [Portunus trituberculatus]|nr:galectin-9-like isoform X3 [Portunus trituberculatus]